MVEENQQNIKVYPFNAVLLGLLAGPFTFTYMMAHNFRAIGMKDLSKQTWIYSVIIVACAILYMSFSDDLVTGFAAILILATTSAFLFLKRPQDEYLENSRTVFSIQHIMKILFIGIAAHVVGFILLTVLVGLLMTLAGMA